MASSLSMGASTRATTGRPARSATRRSTPTGLICGCGNRGCLEAFARGDRIAAACGTATAEEAVERARAGDARAQAGLAEIGRYLGLGIANMITVITPDRIVIGGGVAAAGDVLFDPIRAEVARRVRTTSLDAVQIVPPSWGRGPGRSARRSTAQALATAPVAGPVA